MKDTKKITINLPIALYDRVMEEANKKGLNLTSQIIVYLDKCLNDKDMLDTLVEALPIIKELRDKNEV